jgi:hypothetical protein
MDKSFNGWILDYANTSPYNAHEPIGIIFLLTNIGYVATGLTTLLQGSSYQSIIIELAGLLSVNYHFKQLELGPGNIEVKKALILDYIGACTAITIVLAEVIVQSATGNAPINSIELSFLATACLMYSWVYVNGLEYMFFHGLWHVFSAAATYQLFVKDTQIF